MTPPKPPRLLQGPGVFIAPYLASDGSEVLIAVDAQHRIQRQKRLRHDGSEAFQVRRLEQVLEALAVRPTKRV